MREKAMSTNSDFLSFDPDAWELSVVTHAPRRRWLPASPPGARPLNTEFWQMRAARGLSWHRAGRAARRKRPQ